MPPTSLHRQVLDNLHLAVLVLDSQMHLRYINQAAEILLEASGNRLRGLALRELLTEATQPGESALHHPPASPLPFTKRRAKLRPRHGKELLVDYSLSALTEDGTFVVELSPLDRIRKIAQEEATSAASRANQLLLRGLAHEVKNPLGGLRGAAQLLERELPDPMLHEYTSVIISEADRLRNLVDRMLGPQRPPVLQPINIHEPLEYVARLIRAEATDGNLRLVRDYDPSTPLIAADQEQLVQALLNIMRNAWEAIALGDKLNNARGEIILRTRTLRQQPIGATTHRLVCQLELIDNGPGIPEHLQENIFHPMVSGHAQGSGLGLSIAQSIVHQHEGHIEFQSEPGCTRFVLLFPTIEPRSSDHNGR